MNLDPEPLSSALQRVLLSTEAISPASRAGFSRFALSAVEKVSLDGSRRSLRDFCEPGRSDEPRLAV